MRLSLLFALTLQIWAQASIPPGVSPSSDLKPAQPVDPPGAGDEKIAPIIEKSLLPVPRRADGAPPLGTSRPEGVDWTALFRASGRFLAIEHGFRFLTEPGTRSGMAGSFFANYGAALGNLHGWADGDEFYVNYIGHPMQGSVAGFLWVQSDRAYRGAEFGTNRLYWRSRLRAAAFAWAYSEQFEIGPFSEASLGAIQAAFPQQGFVDHVVTPAIGMGWMIGEDVVDKYLIKRIEIATTNRLLRLVARSALNPSRTFANVLQGEAPWHRGSRAGILSFVPPDRGYTDPIATPGPEVSDVDGPAPFEFSLLFDPLRYLGGGGITCLGGGASAAFRLSEAWQMVAAVGGCKMRGLAENLSGDSLTYMAGPRFHTRDWGRWSANLQVLIGGNKLTEERLYPSTKLLLEAAAARSPRGQPVSHSQYTDETAANGLALNGGCGVNYKLNRALTLRVAELNYQHSWTAHLWGRSFNDAIRLSSGLVLRMGTW